ncbi:hypothetical protein F5B17DRAFT_435844 [Nemania serpens]|nr:hypothetical protein F5B17DRAFT_435844 [Nemania serpens]
MNNLSRHIACKLCRDRKVRCDGGQPSCEKCRRSGETCIYVPTHKPTKADLAQTIESLQERLGTEPSLAKPWGGKERFSHRDVQCRKGADVGEQTDKAEAYILRHSNTNKPTAAAANEQNPMAAASTTSAMGVEYQDCSPFSLNMPASVTTGDPFMSARVHGMPPTPFSHHSLPLSPENLDSEFIGYMPSPHMGVPSDPSHFPTMEDPRRMDDGMSGPSTASSSFRRESVYVHRQMPSLREVRIVNGASVVVSTTSPPPSPSGRGSRADDANHILAELTAFGMVVFSTQAEIAGISSVVAEYLEWLRRSPPTNGQGTPKANPAVLETLETRVRELNALAGARHMDAWRQSVNRLERIPGVGPMLNLFDNEMQRRSGETAEFFHTGYDICSPLAEQLGRKE